MNGKPLLSEPWRDIIAVGSAAISVIGFAIAFWQLRKTKSAVIAARESAERKYEENRDQFQKYVLVCAIRYFDAAKQHAIEDNKEKAGSRLGDLAEQISQLAGNDADWLNLLGKLRTWEAHFKSLKEMKSNQIPKWERFQSELQAKFDRHHGPYK